MFLHNTCVLVWVGFPLHRSLYLQMLIASFVHTHLGLPQNCHSQWHVWFTFTECLFGRTSSTSCFPHRPNSSWGGEGVIDDVGEECGRVNDCQEISFLVEEYTIYILIWLTFLGGFCIGKMEVRNCQWKQKRMPMAIISQLTVLVMIVRDWEATVKLLVVRYETLSTLVNHWDCQNIDGQIGQVP